MSNPQIFIKQDPQTGLITFQNEYARFQLNSGNGKSHSFFLLKAKEELIPEESDFAIYFIHSNPKEYESSTSIKYLETGLDSGLMQVFFDTGVKFLIEYTVRPDHFLFELKAIDGPEDIVDEIGLAGMAQMFLYGDEYGDLLGVIGKSGYRIAGLPLNGFTHAFSNTTGKQGPVFQLRTQSFQLPGFNYLQLTGAKIALLVSPKEELQDRIHDIAVQYSLPIPTYEQVWQKRHPDVKTSYLFVDITLDNSDAIIELAKKGGFKHIMPYIGTWAQTKGSCKIHPHNYPHDDADPETQSLEDEVTSLKEVVEKVHANGMKFGLHHLALGIARDDREPLVSPEPDSRLLKDQRVFLAKKISDGKDWNEPQDWFIPIDPATPENLLVAYENAFSAGENEILIGSEIIQCSAFQKGDDSDPPAPGFLVFHDETKDKSGRGLWGTNPQEHEAGAAIYHLPIYFGTYLADLHSDLPDEIAERLGDICRETGIDFVFLDGNDGSYRQIPPIYGFMLQGKWFAAGYTAQKFLEYLPEHVLLQTAALQRNLGYGWHFSARGGSGDFALINVEAHLDHSRIGHRRDQRYLPSAMPQELGWFALQAKLIVNNSSGKQDCFASTTLDEIEYLMNHSLAFDLPVSIETRKAFLDQNQHTDSIFELIGKYEKLRLSNYFSESFRQQLQHTDKELMTTHGLAKEQWHLVRHFLFGYGFRRQAYLEKVLYNNQQWTFTNPFPEQSLKVKITALPAHDLANGSNTIELLQKESIEHSKCLNKYIQALDDLISTEGLFRVTYQPDPPANYPEYGWISYTQSIPEAARDLSSHKYLWVDFESDGNGAVVNFQLTDNRGRHRMFQLVLDESLQGNHQQVFYFPVGREYYQYLPDFGGVMNLRDFDYAHVVQLTIYIKQIPQTSAGIRFQLFSLQALQQYPNQVLHDPKISLNQKGAGIQFSQTLLPRHPSAQIEPWEYAEFDGRQFRKYDGNHQPLAEDPPLFSYQLPLVKKGENKLTYQHKGENPVLLRILLEGNPVYPWGWMGGFRFWFRNTLKA